MKIEPFTNFVLKFGLLFKRAYYGMTRERIPDFASIKTLFFAKSGLEVGGPSRIFRDGGFLPLYHVVKTLDGCNFSNTTIWEGAIESGQNYHYYATKNGLQFVLEASDLSIIASSKYEFLISSNCLEHVANPLKAVSEWIRVLKEDGLLLLVLPNKEYTFDHKRSVTTFSHLLSDFKNQVKEDDLTHLAEILELHDLEMDKHAGTSEQFRVRTLKNFENRALHQHVFDRTVLEEMFNHFKMDVLLSHVGRDIIILGRKTNK